MHKLTRNGDGSIIHRSLLYFSQVHTECNEEKELFRRLNSHTRVAFYL